MALPQLPGNPGEDFIETGFYRCGIVQTEMSGMYSGRGIKPPDGAIRVVDIVKAEPAFVAAG